jgi:ferric-dicitrate binding protein FerR (iron transport regulator)
MDPNFRIADLINKHLEGTISETEREELDAWVEEEPTNRRVFEWYTSGFFATELRRVYAYDVDAGWSKLLQRTNIPLERKIVRMRWKWITSVAAVLVALCLLTWLMVAPKKTKPTATRNTDLTYKNDIAPGGDRARLTLADGRVIVLDSAANGALVKMGDVRVLKLEDGKLKYDGGSQKSEVTYNTLSTPKGGQYMVVLPDGSKVWLNAASSIKYPTVFTGNQRRIEMTGEAYFEISKDAKRPFRVFVLPTSNRRGGLIEVIGTHFNINAYEDEAGIKTTLLEGRVDVSVPVTDEVATGTNHQQQTPPERTRSVPAGTNNKLQTVHHKQLLPGQQAQLTDNGQITINKEADTDEATAWKDGFFQFRNTPIDAILRQAARWYDVDIKYESRPTEPLSGRVPRSVPVSQLLRLLEATGGVHFGVEGKTVIVRK